MKPQGRKIVLTCEHGGNQIPAEYSAYFKTEEDVLQSHRGYDIGALELFQKFKPKADFSQYSTTSRLLVELNRSLHHAQLFSEFMHPLDHQQTQQLLDHYYHPYRQRVEKQITEWVNKGYRILHLSVHSFTPVFNGKERKTDVGLLYDPKREEEQLFAARWRQHLQQLKPQYKVRYNDPYKGTADGFVTQLRKQFTNQQYAGLELEVNQKYAQGEPVEWLALQKALVQSFVQAF